MHGIERYSTFTFGDMTVSYLLDTANGRIGFLLHPRSKPDRLDLHRRDLSEVREVNHYINGIGAKSPVAFRIEPLVAYAVAGSVRQGGLTAGVSQRNDSSSDRCKFVSQEVKTEGGKTTVITISRDETSGIEYLHALTYCQDDRHVTIRSRLRNRSTENRMITMAHGGALGCISPYATSTQGNRLTIHRIRGGWSNEGRRESETLESLGLEQSWSNHALRCERFGQAGSLANLRWFPVVAVEDEQEHVFWGFKLACPASWQIEIAAQDDFLSISGGYADQEMGHWCKRLDPNEELVLPELLVSTAYTQDFLAFAQRIPLASRPLSNVSRPSDPVVFNDWCTVWGATSDASVRRLLPLCKEVGARFFVIDAGWYADVQGSWAEGQGDWIPSLARYPEGLAHTCAMIRQQGIVPGLWCEPEAVGPKSSLWECHDWLLHKDGVPIQVGCRRFLDLRNHEVLDYLEQKLGTLISSCNLGYLKLDANESVGIGCDGVESAGEELRLHMEGLSSLLRRLGERFPDLVMENCAAGGLRLEPHMVGLATITSATDAHEIISIPIIVANEYHMARPDQLLVWTVLRQEDDPRRFHYTLASSFLGIMCLSGDLPLLHGWQKDRLKEAIRLHEASRILQQDASIRIWGEPVRSYLEPKGYQAVLFVREHTLLIVMHTFASETTTCTLPLAQYRPQSIAWQFSESSLTFDLQSSGDLVFSHVPPFSGMVVSLARRADMCATPSDTCTPAHSPTYDPSDQSAHGSKNTVSNPT